MFSFKAIEQRFTAARAVIVAVLALSGCSGESGHAGIMEGVGSHAGEDSSGNAGSSTVKSKSVAGSGGSAPSAGSSSGGSDSPVDVCTPGESADCVDENGAAGIQLCKIDGSGFGDCQVDPDVPAVCIPGEARECSCEDGRSGDQACLNDASDYGACSCFGPVVNNGGGTSAGGSSSNGGSSGSAGSGGSGSPVDVCTPGESADCVDENGAAGIQLCKVDGSGFGDCQVDPDVPPSGGSSAGGSASAGSGSGGSAQAGTGGTSAGGSSSNGGSSGSAGSGGAQGGQPPVLQPFSYGAPVQDTSFPVGWDLTHRAWASGPSDVYVPVSKVDASASGGYVSAIAHKDANGWSLELAGVYVWCKEVSGADANNVYAGCVKYEDYFYKGVIVRRIGKNNWQEVKMFGLTKPDVTSLWCASASDCFAVVQHCQDATHCWPTLWRGSGTTWNTMSVPLVSNGTGRRVRCISPGDCYVIGEEGPKAFLWQLVGSSWKNVTTLPSDVTYLWDLSGTDEELVVVGQTEDAGVKNGVRLTSDDFVSWDRDDSPETAVDGSVWVPWNGSALVAGTIEDESGLQYPGDARLCGKSLGLFAEETSVDGTLLGVTSIIPISDNTVLLTAYGSIDAHVASVYVVTYQ